VWPIGTPPLWTLSSTLQRGDELASGTRCDGEPPARHCADPVGEHLGATEDGVEPQRPRRRHLDVDLGKGIVQRDLLVAALLRGVRLLFTARATVSGDGATRTGDKPEGRRACRRST
jgi:hypothetical protein